MIDSISERSTFSALRRPDARVHAGSVRIDHLCVDPSASTSPRPRSVDRENRAAVRVAYAIGSHVGGAVVRNRLRRQFRSITAELAADGAMRPGAYLIVAKDRARERSFVALKDDVRRALHKLDEKMGASSSSSSNRRESASA